MRLRLARGPEAQVAGLLETKPGKGILVISKFPTPIELSRLHATGRVTPLTPFLETRNCQVGAHRRTLTGEIAYAEPATSPPPLRFAGPFEQTKSRREINRNTGAAAIQRSQKEAACSISAIAGIGKYGIAASFYKRDQGEAGFLKAVVTGATEQRCTSGFITRYQAAFVEYLSQSETLSGLAVLTLQPQETNPRCTGSRTALLAAVRPERRVRTGVIRAFD